MTEEMEKMLIKQDWWIILDSLENKKELWVGTAIKGFGKMEIPESQLIHLEEKYNTKCTRLIGG